MHVVFRLDDNHRFDVPYVDYTRFLAVSAAYPLRVAHGRDGSVLIHEEEAGGRDSIPWDVTQEAHRFWSRPSELVFDSVEDRSVRMLTNLADLEAAKHPLSPLVLAWDAGGRGLFYNARNHKYDVSEMASMYGMKPVGALCAVFSTSPCWLDGARRLVERSSERSVYKVVATGAPPKHLLACYEGDDFVSSFQKVGDIGKVKLAAFHLGDVQAYFDLMLFSGKDPAVALKETQARFKLSGISMTPTMRVEAPGVDPAPKLGFDPVTGVPVPPMGAAPPLPGEEPSSGATGSEF